ncbi:MAG: hypothetical protein JNJ59_19250 [Deltaproteobacteria bacterium]|nr:hypothetical protein [Deltaproteobacteria bacterium]
MRQRIRLVAASLLATLGGACGDETSSPDTNDTTDTIEVADGDTGDTTDTTDTTDSVDDVEVGDTDTSAPTFAAVHVWSADGATVHARFDTALDLLTSASAFALVGADASRATITGLTLDGASVTLTVSPPLATTQTWDLVVTGLRALDGKTLTATVPVKSTLFLNMVWHQHQPSYLDPMKDELQGPWVRKHATKDYFDMTAMLARYPKIHVNVNLTSSLLTQLQRYVDALGPFVDTATDTVDEAGFLAAWEGHTDPWVDLLLKDTPKPNTATELEQDRYWKGVWSLKSIAEPLRDFFPEYKTLLAKAGATYTQVDLALLKVWFELAWMDPDFLRGPVTVYRDNGQDVVVDLSDVVVRDETGHFTLALRYTDPEVAESERLLRLEALANRLVAESYEIMRGVFEVHKTMGWTGTNGQVEVLTTPFFHPILPLLFDTDLAKVGQPADPMPSPAFKRPGDAALQIAMAVEYYTSVFGRAPRGMWPSEGAVAEQIVPALVDNGIDWIATDRQVLDRGKPGATHLEGYKVDKDLVVGDGGATDDELMIVFRDTEISDKVGFFYQSNPPAANVADFVTSVLGKAPRFGERGRLLSVILDGENAWEWYLQDHDAKVFLNGLYAALEGAYDNGSIITVTGSEHLDGNAARHVPAHPVNAMPEYEGLIPGSWIGGRLDTWIGEAEENLAWIYLRTARDELEAAKAALVPKIGMPASYLTPPADDGGNGAKLHWWKAWRNVLSAEGSDWFWWYGSDQTAAGGDDSPFDEIFRAQLTAAYTELNLALIAEGLAPVAVPAFPPILQPEPVRLSGPFTKAPVLDGLISPDNEWVPPGGIFFDGDSSGAMADPNDDIARVLFGYDAAGKVYLGIDLREDLSAKIESDYQIVIYTSQGHMSGTELVQDPFNTQTKEGTNVVFASGGPARRIAIDFSGAVPVATVQKADGSGGWGGVEATVALGGPVAGGTLLELSFLLADFGMVVGDPLEIAVLAVDGGQVVDTAPNLGTQVVFADPTKLVTVILELDATGVSIPLNQFITLTDPPPPTGAGEPSIVGNQEAFANWAPNTIMMKDDGVAPDKTAGDHVYTLASTFVPGTGLQYKYTIGHAGLGWGGTEEYPLTNRGYTVPVDGTRRVRVRDIFADRPDPSGSMAKLTTVTIEE